MSTEDASSDLLPVHLQPRDDELLSSWLVRLAIAHELKPDTFYSLMSPRFPKFPLYIDETPDDRTLSMIRLTTGVSIEKVKTTTFTPYENTFSRYHYSGRTGPRSLLYQWLMPTSHRHSRYQLFGLQYCPGCLCEDKVPYFRRRWRFAFVTLCGTHRTLLLDRCVCCGLPIDFRRNAAETRRKKRPTLTMLKCHSCKFDMRTAALVAPPRNSFPDDLEFQEYLLKALDKDEVIDQQGESYAVSSFFYKLYSLTKLLAFGKFGGFVRTQLCKRYGLRTFTVAQPEKYQSLEVLNVGERFALIRVASRTMGEWPNDLMSFGWTNNSQLPYPPLADDA